MIWVYTEDNFYYSIEEQNLIKQKYDIEKLIIVPNEEHIKDHIGSEIIFMAPYQPPLKYKDLIPVEFLENKHGILTNQEKNLGVTEESALEQRLGITIIKSPFGLDDVGGATLLKQWANDFLAAEQQGYKAKAIFLVGIPGTGKTFFSKCLSGHLDRKLIILNLSSIMEKEQPIITLFKIFDYLNMKRSEKFIILIDEIEKMIGNNVAEEKRILGAFLTLLNDLNTKASRYQFDALFVATANSLTTILDNNPELLRRGRFDELFFINLPTFEMSKEIIELYAKKFNLMHIFEIISMDDLVLKIEDTYQHCNDQAHLFPYTPSEVENLFKRLDFMRMARGEITYEIICESIRMIMPIIQSAKGGINKMVAQKDLFIEI